MQPERACRSVLPFTHPAAAVVYPLSLHDALPISLDIEQRATLIIESAPVDEEAAGAGEHYSPPEDKSELQPHQAPVCGVRRAKRHCRRPGASQDPISPIECPVAWDVKTC